jgi:hypothetical protein
MGENVMKSASIEVAGALADLSKKYKEFFDQTYMEIANKHYGLAQNAMLGLVDDQGNIQIASLDQFHNQLDEYQRALKQVMAGQFTDKENEKKHISGEAGIAKKFDQELRELHKKVNSITGICPACEITEKGEIKASVKGKPPQEMVTHIERVLNQVEVVMDNRGLRDMTTPGKTASQGFNKELAKLRDIAQHMSDNDNVFHLKQFNEQVSVVVLSADALKKQLGEALRDRVEKIAIPTLKQLEKDVNESSLKFSSLVKPGEGPKLAAADIGNIRHDEGQRPNAPTAKSGTRTITI